MTHDLAINVCTAWADCLESFLVLNFDHFSALSFGCWKGSDLNSHTSVDLVNLLESLNEIEKSTVVFDWDCDSTLVLTIK